MKKLIKLVLVVLLVCFAVPALANDLVINKRVTIDINKDVDLTVRSQFDPKEWAECEVYKKDLNEGNRVTEDPFSWCFFDPAKNSIDGSFVAFSGIAQVNQSAGSINNQGNITTIAATNADNGGYSYGIFPGGKKDGGLSHTEVAVEQVNLSNTLTSKFAIHTDEITSSFTSFRGVAQVNQASGFMNNQNNVVGISANLCNGAVALSDALLTQTNSGSGSTVNLTAVNYTATISNSFSGAGIAQVNQSPGSMNNQANIVSFSYAGVK